MSKDSSRYGVGQTVYMHPALGSLNAAEIQKHGIMAKVVGVNFMATAVTYELALNVAKPGAEPQFYEQIPVAAVDSYFVVSASDLANRGKAGAEDEYKSYASSRTERSDKEIRTFASRFRMIESDLAEMRR